MDLCSRSYGDWIYGETPSENVLKELADKHGMKVWDKVFQVFLDSNDKLKRFRDDFCIPKMETYPKATSNEGEVINLCGHALGIQAKRAEELILKVLNNWKVRSLETHYSGFLPAAYCDTYVYEDLGQLVGAFKDEVTVMNGVSVNLHLMLISFYQPTSTRYKILIEQDAFSSDYYITESQIRQRGLDPADCLLLAKRRKGENTWRMNDILELIEKEGDTISVVLFAGVHYFTGQVFDMEAITKAAHDKGCMVGFDLAHAIGNVEIHLHDWKVDFACWCNYKYLNAGPGAIGGAFMHRKHRKNNFPKLIGWWGHKSESRFRMKIDSDLSEGVEAYRITNPPPLLVAPLRASLDVFKQTNMRELREKSFLLTGYLECLLVHFFSFKNTGKHVLEVITPSGYKERGCQLSIKFRSPINEILPKLEERGVICDARKPDILRFAPVPLYNSFHDVFRFVEILRNILAEI